MSWVGIGSPSGGCPVRIMTTHLVQDHRWHTCPVRPDDERERLRHTFNRAAEIYDRVRPDYPEALFDELVALAGLAPGDHLVEVGCATGKATRPLARRGFRITCVELGAAARRNLAGFQVEVVEGRFEEWRPHEPARLVYA